MAKVLAPQVLTANRLVTGEVVYWRGGRWTPSFADAQVFGIAESAAAALEDAKAHVAARAIVNPYLFAVKAEAGELHPIEEREIIRAAGPTVRPDLSRQVSHVLL